MRCCVISLSGRKYSVIFVAGDEPLALPAGIPPDTCPVFVAPSECADFRVRRAGAAREQKTEPLFLAAALSFFFHIKRGLPYGSVELEYECDGRASQLRLFVTGGDRRGIFLPKCKELYTNTVKAADGVELTVYDIALGEGWRGMFAERAEQLDVGVLRRLFVARDLPVLRRTLAVGLSEPHELILPRGKELSLDAVAAGAYMLEHRAGGGASALGLSYRGARIELLRSEAGFYLPASAEIIC